MKLTDPITVLKGLGPKKAEILEKRNIQTIEDLLFLFPRTYQDRRVLCPIDKLQEGVPALIKGTIKLIVKTGSPYGKKQTLRLLVEDETGAIEVVFFHAKYLLSRFKQGESYYFFGKLTVNYGKQQMIHPEVTESEDEIYRGILPIYPLSAGLNQKEMQQWQRMISTFVPEISEYLPREILQKNHLRGIDFSLKHIHFPQEKEPLLQAKYRLIYDELFILLLGLLMAKQQIQQEKKGIPFFQNINTDTYTKELNFSLTKAQRRVIKEINRDLESGKVMNRLVQGDVGSGKTAVAEVALFKAVKSGFQGVLMAPTELLAKQHFAGLVKNFQTHDINVGLLIGNMSKADRIETLEKLKTGQLQILVGTHAVFQPEVVFENLGLVITDEQHRFGVRQRRLLSEKGDHPHVLVMTATPIPRTLAVFLYGDLDVSVIDELPPGRQKIVTRSITDKQRDQCYDFVKKELEKGRQAYVVAPLIEESEVLEAKSAEELYDELKQRFTGKKVALLHGELKQSEKDDIMTDFYKGNIQVLISTVVIEVGIHVPNATIMVIESAERFGLAQMHQLRGRIGRGEHKSYCILISQSHTEVAVKRTEIMVNSQDGFFIAEKDLEIRGPGELFGTRQHGLPDLHLADLVKHMDILLVAKDDAKNMIDIDPGLEQPENKSLKEKVQKLFRTSFSL